MKIQHALKSFLGLKKAVATLLIAIPFVAIAGVDTETDENGVILAGHDVVAYFTESKPVLGKSEYTAVHNNAIYRFSSASNRDTFTKAPSKYAPQYGGFCAYGASLGKKFSVDGKAFEVVDGKLYVNKNLNVYEIWKKDKTGYIKTADSKWSAIQATAADKL